MRIFAYLSHLALLKHARILMTALISLGFGAGMASSQDLPVEKALPLALALEAAQVACVQQGCRVSAAIAGSESSLLMRASSPPPRI